LSYWYYWVLDIGIIQKIYKYLNVWNILKNMNITNILTEHIINNKPISFSKYGDGEFYCAFVRHGRNCDNDTYTYKLGNSLINSFKYMVECAENYYIGKWHD